MLGQARVAGANQIELTVFKLFEVQQGVVRPCRSAKQLFQLHLHSLGITGGRRRVAAIELFYTHAQRASRRAVSSLRAQLNLKRGAGRLARSRCSSFSTTAPRSTCCGPRLMTPACWSRSSPAARTRRSTVARS